jgi:hypothetical protein
MRGHDRGYLFSGGRLSETLDGHRTAALNEVERVPKNQFLGTTVDTLVESICSKAAIEKLVIFEDRMAMDQSETKIEVTGRFDYGLDRGARAFANGHQFSFFLPFSGEASLWQLQPNKYSSMPPRGHVDSRTSVLTISLSNTSNTDQSWYQSELQQQLKGIRDYVTWQEQLLAQFERELPAQVRAAVESRRAQLEQLQGLAAAFNIPIEVHRKIAKPLPRPPANGYKAEPAIASELYEDLLGIVRHAGASFEGTPQTYLPLGEEGLRDNLLSHINVVFEGKATGETFRKYGKIDIRLEEETRSAFVAECKLWGGQKVLLEALTNYWVTSPGATARRRSSSSIRTWRRFPVFRRQLPQHSNPIPTTYGRSLLAARANGDLCFGRPKTKAGRSPSMCLLSTCMWRRNVRPNVGDASGYWY